MTLRFNTRAIHAGQEPDPITGAVIPPIYQTSTFAQDGIGQLRSGYEYSRSANPSRTALQENLAALEGGTHGFSFASGLAAEDTLVRALLRPGDRLLVSSDAYGGTHRLFGQVHTEWGLEVVPTDFADVDALRDSLAQSPAAMIWVETPTNPLMSVVDIAAVATVAREHGAFLVVDNTFASPYLQQPLSLGADAVVHSTTKYIGGHSDVVGGAIVLDDDEAAQKIAYLQNAAGAVSGPFDAWLTLRGIKTLGVRMDRHSSNAAQIAEYLVSHPAVERVYYPGLPDHPGHEIAAKQMKSFGGMLSVALRGGAAAALKLAESTELFTLAESLGGVESLIGYPTEMTHAALKGTPMEVPDNIIRISVGIEDVEDLQEDLGKALAN
ncbi:cystathionine gamma-synthase [Sediminivirga luteola]|uniref:Cystathionine gamma-synthase n=1 Tax=Sediminivirga luteola TaxID=1774748 RepID=A0A8J2TVK3_9MICO|nr:cystathionine gamma-synthase [Sediminivirga luteola]MCI2265901.1 cystathionine gamma-synthase [Sediminivirga luteola]GGA03939.1 cystathionine gamma-synthase [Sediminivirga luteola]